MDPCDSRCDCKKGASRREFLQMGVGLAAAGAVARSGIAVAASPGFFPPSAQTPPPKEWFDALFQRGEPPAYHGESLRHVALPLGGIGTGTVWLHGSGRLTAWQIFNNINKATQVDDSFFAVRVEPEGGPPVVRALQMAPIGPFKGVESVRFVGQYPFAYLEFSDPALPVRVRLEAFNPLVPLDDKDSGLPGAIFQFSAKNVGRVNARVTFLASLQNAVGHQGRGASVGTRHTTYGRNVNTLLRTEAMVAVRMHAEPGVPAAFDRPMTLRADDNLIAPDDTWPVQNLRLCGLASPGETADASTVFFVSRGEVARLGGATLAAIAAAVKDGATLLLAGADNPLLRPVAADAPPGTRRDEVVFADFDSGTYGNWKVEGQGFGDRPANGTSPGQNPVSGFLGSGLVNTFRPDDGPQGRLLSPPFRIEKPYISFLIGGGAHPGKTCLNLRVGNRIVRTAVGKNAEALERQTWDVRDLIGEEAWLEIVDAESGGWGHINVDDIRFATSAVESITEAEAAAWREMLPAVFDAAAPDAKKKECLVAVDRTVPELAAVTTDRLRLAAVPGRRPSSVRADARTLLSFEDGTPAMILGACGKGRVFVVPADLGADEADPVLRRDAVLSLVAGLAGARFEPAAGRPTNAPSFGTMCLATPDRQATFLTAWRDREELLRDFLENGDLADKREREGPTPAGETINAALTSSTSIGPGAAADACFVLAWHFPNQYYPQDAWRIGRSDIKPVGNMYANWFPDASAVAAYILRSLGSLTRRTEQYRDCLYESSLPHYLVDCIGANVSIARSPTCFRIKDGTFYGFEGCSPGGGGCCPMNCNHVWNYEQTVAKLWPALERDMRVTELVYHQLPEGGVHHRVGVPRENTWRSGPVADGQCGAVLKAWREHRQSGNGDFLAQHWPRIRKAMDFAIANWDADADGVMEKPQFNTYDRVIFGHNTFISSLYLAALRAAEEMAGLAKDAEAAARYRKLFESGREIAAKDLFNGEYYIQKADDLTGGYGVGCCSDQVVGQWWARVVGLGDILPNEQVRSALKAIFRYCWLTNMEGFEGTQRYLEFANREDKGLLIAAWPKGGRPADPIYYRDEMFTGVEYQVAAHMIYEGLLREGLAIVKGARERYAGRNKNPWNEIECGDYYARAMSSWSLLLAAQGYTYDGPARRIGFDPRLTPDDHRSFFSAAEGWGRFVQRRDGGVQINRLEVAAGVVELSEVRFGLPAGTDRIRATATLGLQVLRPEVRVDGGAAVLRFESPVRVEAKEPLEIRIERL